MKNMDKVLKVRKWFGQKNTPNVFAQFVCPSPKVWDLNQKRLHWPSVVCDWIKITNSRDREFWNHEMWKCCDFKNALTQLWREDRRGPLARRHWELVEHKKVPLSCTIIAVRKRYLTSILTFWLSKKLLVNYGFMKVSVQGVESLPILCMAFQIVLETDLFYIT